MLKSNRNVGFLKIYTVKIFVEIVLNYIVKIPKDLFCELICFHFCY